MRKVTLLLVIAIGFGLLSGGPRPAIAAGGAEYEHQEWTFNGIFGRFDRAALRRGHQVYREVCSACHGLKRIAYRNLMDIGFSEEEAKEIAAEATVTDGPNDEGEMFDRSGKLSDRFVSPFPNDQAARYSNNGALPPDLSLIVKARKGGADYLYSLMTGYADEAPEGMEMMDGMSYNRAFPGHQIAMPQPLYEDLIEYEDGTPASVEQQAKDVTTFLAWAAEPELEARKSLGLKVLLFMILLTAMLYAVKRRVWSKLH
ncbi:MAG: cytochrome c1 [Alphaproteobacteria bacterium]|nr:cytochrome c1 [Alphaproteobacteria bacterium]